MEEKNYYKILGVDKKATQEQIKKAFRKKAAIFHPDKQIGKTDDEKKKAEDEFKLINTVNEVLSDPEKRKLYDQFGEGLGKNQWYGQPQEGDLHDFIRRQQEAFFGGMNQQDPREYANIRINFSMSLEDLYSDKSIKKTFKYNRKIVCSHCSGNGIGHGGKKITCSTCRGQGFLNQQVGYGVHMQIVCPSCLGEKYIIDIPCPHCKNGFISKQEKIDVEIPIGSIFKPIQLYSKGNEIIFNNTKYVGDLFINVKPLEDREYQLDNQGNIHKIIEVSIFDCIIGENIKFKYLNKTEKQFKLNFGTKEGQQFRLNNLGLPTPNGNRTNLYIHISQKYPEKLTEEQIIFLKKIK